MIITPNYKKQKGLFYHIKQKKGEKLHSFVKVLGTRLDESFDINTIIDDSYENRFCSAENQRDLEVLFPSFPLRITHFAIKALKNYYSAA